MVSDRDREIIRRRFAAEPDPDQLSLLADETLDPVRDHWVPEPESRQQPMRKARAHE